MARNWKFEYHYGWRGVADTGETTATFGLFQEVLDAIEAGEFS